MSESRELRARAPHGDPSRLGSILRMLVPSATMFFSGGCIMILELVASRLVARDLGSSLYTWTSILGIVLAGISIGSYVGGRIGDRYHVQRALAVLFGLSSAACVAIVVLNNAVAGWIWLWRLSWPTHVFIHVSLVFLVPSVLLGTISPVVAKMALNQGLATGRTVGILYAWGAAGSIVGTFLAGFFLIPSFGSVAIIWFIGASLLAMAVLYWISCWAMYLWVMIFVALAAMGMVQDDWAKDAGAAALLRVQPDPNVIYENETQYSHITVKQLSKRPDRRAFVQDKLAHSEMVSDDATNLPYFYTKVSAGLTHGLCKDKKHLSLMVIGGGGYTFPRYLKSAWPTCSVEVVEIDPGVTEAAIAAFGLDNHADIKTVNMDARSYVGQLLAWERAGKPLNRYDFIYEDAINDYSVPSQLVTKEFNDKLLRLLTDDGVYMVNLIDTPENGQFAGAVLNTLEQTFPYVCMIAGEANLPSLRDTFVAVASRRRIDAHAILTEHNKHLRFRLLDDSEEADLRNKCRHIVLSDDYAPVENLLAPVVQQGAREILAQKHLERATQLQRDGTDRQTGGGDVQANALYEQSIAQYRRALELNPSLATKAYHEIGLMYVAQDKHEKAIQAFQDAIKSHADAGRRQTAIASVHMNLGILLRRLNRPKEAREQLTKAAEWFRIELEENPNSVVVWDWLGDTSAGLGDLKGASNAFEKAMTLEPSNPSHYEKLARMLEPQHRYDEAIQVVRKHVELMQQQGRRDLAAQLRQYIELLEYNKVKQSR